LPELDVLRRQAERRAQEATITDDTDKGKT